jgi:hypothetical protein
MVRTLIAGAAVTGALTLGAAGAAGAASTATSASGSGAAKAAVCAQLPKLENQVHRHDRKVATRVAKYQAQEAKAKAAGKTKAAEALRKHISRVQARTAKGNAGLASDEAKCGASDAPGKGGATSG